MRDVRKVLVMVFQTGPRRSLVRILRERGVNARATTSLDTAKRELVKYPPEVLVVDHVLPDGQDAIAWLENLGPPVTELELAVLALSPNPPKSEGVGDSPAKFHVAYVPRPTTMRRDLEIVSDAVEWALGQCREGWGEWTSHGLGWGYERRSPRAEGDRARALKESPPKASGLQSELDGILGFSPDLEIRDQGTSPRIRAKTEPTEGAVEQRRVAHPPPGMTADESAAARLESERSDGSEGRTGQERRKKSKDDVERGAVESSRSTTKKRETWVERRLLMDLDFVHRPPTLNGSLANWSVPELLSSFYAEGSSGRLHLRQGNVEKLVHFLGGYPVFVESNQLSETLGDQLRQEGKLRPTDHEALLDEMSQTGVRMGQLLVGRGLLEPGELREVLRYNLAEKLVSTFGWTEGEFFHDSDAELGNQDFSFSLSPFRIVLDGVQRLSDDAIISRYLPLD